MSWAEVYKAINNNLDKPLNEQLNEQLGAESNEIQSLINTLFSKGFVKSVQRGTIATTSASASNTRIFTDEITLSAVDPNKCIVTIEFFPYGYTISSSFLSSDDANFNYYPSLTYTLSASKLTVTKSPSYWKETWNSAYTKYSVSKAMCCGYNWQVIEFY